MESTRRGPYLLVSSKEVYKNPWIRVREDRVLTPSGGDGLFGIVQLKPGSSVLPLAANGDVYLVREYKYALERASIEVISGGIEPEESPLEAARRELKEETGLEAAEWIDLGTVDPFTVVVQSPNHLFLARQLTCGERSPDEGEVIELLRVPFMEAVAMVMRGEITHAGSCILIMKAQEYLRRQAAGRSAREGEG